MDFLSIISKRRDGQCHSEEELRFLAKGAASGSIPDYQLSAWLMAAVLKPLSPQETAWLTLAMAQSGETLDLSELPKPCIDKHSTGGVGDKTSIVLLPLLASCGVSVVKMSGRGLGITGGTVDKLESIPGFRMDLTPKELIAQAKRIGIAITGPTAALAPADKVLYALRDATATVASVPLIVSSILSKKIAAGAKTVLLDVKCGQGAFMPNLDAAEELAHALQKTAGLCGIELKLAITDMNQPLGRAVGNALEVREAIEVLQGDISSRFAQLCMKLGGMALEAIGRARTEEEGRIQATEAIQRSLAFNKAKEWIQAQGGDVAVLDGGSGLPTAKIVKPVRYQGPRKWVAGVQAALVGRVALDLGAGRKSKSDVIDPAVGIEVLVTVGTEVAAGHPLFRIHAQADEQAEQAEKELESAVVLLDEPAPEPPLILASM